MSKQRITLVLAVCSVAALWVLLLWPQAPSAAPSAATVTTADKQPVPAFSHEDFERQVKKLTIAMEGGGVETSFVLVDKSLGLNPTFARSCHPLLHRLGHAAYKHYGSFAAAMAPAKEICNSGYIHGVIEANFVNQPDMATAMASSCPDTQSADFANWQCFHGAGHGAMYRLDGSVSESLGVCQSLASDFARQACANGVYMEAFNMLDHGGDHGSAKVDPGMDLCRSEPRYRHDCYFYAPGAYLQAHDSDYRQAIDWCQSAEDRYVSDCVRGVGSQAMKDSISRPAVAAAVCASAPAQYRETCVGGAVGLAVNHHGKSEPAKALCDGDFKSFRDSCLKAVADKQRAYDI